MEEPVFDADRIYAQHDARSVNDLVTLSIQDTKSLKRPSGSEIHVEDAVQKHTSAPAKLTKVSHASSPLIFTAQVPANISSLPDQHHVRSERMLAHRSVEFQAAAADGISLNSTAYQNRTSSPTPVKVKSQEPPLPEGPNRSSNHLVERMTRNRLNLNTSANELLPNLRLVRQPESREISEQQLADEVTGIYAALLLIEGKCIHVVGARNSGLREAAKQGDKEANKRQNEHWQELINYHRTLLHEHHDFFLASQHPSASSSVKQLATKYGMPARMWKYGIHNFLELLRHNLPQSGEYMLAFIYLAYQTMAQLYETISSFEETWIECLGDLARYRMAIEDSDPKDRDIWTGTARYWYCKALDKNPGVGRLQHHLAILSRTYALQQLACYCKSLTALQPFPNTKDSIATLFEPMLSRDETGGATSFSIETWFVKCHALMFGNGDEQRFQVMYEYFVNGLSSHIKRHQLRWRNCGIFIAQANIAALQSYGSPESTIQHILLGSQKSTPLRYDKNGNEPASLSIIIPLYV